MSDTKEHDDTEPTADEIATAKAQFVQKAYDDAFQARNNAQGLKNQRGMITQANAGLDQQFAEARAAAERRRARAKTATEAADKLDGELEADEKKVTELTKGVADLDATIAGWVELGIGVDSLQEAKQKMQADLDTAKRKLSEKKAQIKEHRDHATAQTESAAQAFDSGTNQHQNDAMHALSGIEGQIAFNEKKAADKQKEAEEAQAMSDAEWAAKPENRKLIKTLVGEATKAAMDAEDKAKTKALEDSAKRMSDLLVPDAEMKTLGDTVSLAKLHLQVAGRLPSHVPGAMDAGEALSKGNTVDQDYQAIVTMRSELAKEAAAADEGDEAEKEKFKKESAELRKKVSEFKTKYSDTAAPDFESMLPKVDELEKLSKSQEVMVAVRAAAGKESMATATTQLGAFPGRAKERHAALKVNVTSLKTGPGKAGADTWQQDVYKFIDKVNDATNDIATYRQKVTALKGMAPGSKSAALALLAEIADIGAD